MPGPAWGPDAPTDAPVIQANVRALLVQLHAQASARVTPDVALAHDWHRAIYQGTASPPGPHYLGAFRGSAHPDLVDYPVAIGNAAGQVLAVTPEPNDVAGHLLHLDSALKNAAGALDQLIPVGAKPATTGQLEAVVTLAASVHSRWVCIHPYANGNGRTARVWANWVALRYGLPPFVRIKPRPDGLLYALAAARGMGTPPDFHDDPITTYSLFLDLLAQQP